MSEYNIHNQLNHLARLLDWKALSIGISRGIYYLEVETKEQYDEIPFESEEELREYVKEMFITS